MNKTVTRLLGGGADYLVLFVFAAVFAAPILFMAAGSLKPDARVLVEAAELRTWLPTDASLQNYRDVFSRVAFMRFMANSLFVTGSIVLAGLIINGLAGYAFARLHWRGRRVLLGFVFAIMIIPLEAIAVPLFYEVTVLGWRNTYFVQIVPFVANAFSIFLFYSFFRDLPRELEEAAYLDGAGTLRIFVSIIVPNTLPAFATVAILSFLTQWASFLWPLLATTTENVRPLPLAIATFYTLPPLRWGDIFAFGMMMVAPVLIVFIVFQKYFVRGVAASGIKG